MSEKKGWMEEIKKIKEETKSEVSQISSAEEELREKYKAQKKEIIDMIHSELKAVEETFKDPDLQKYEQPKIERRGDWEISLSLPIVSVETHIGSGISFSMALAGDGYRVDVKRNGRSRSIFPPIEVKAIREDIVQYLKSRKETIISMEKKRQRFIREFG